MYKDQSERTWIRPATWKNGSLLEDDTKSGIAEMRPLLCVLHSLGSATLIVGPGRTHVYSFTGSDKSFDAWLSSKGTSELRRAIPPRAHIIADFAHILPFWNTVLELLDKKRRLIKQTQIDVTYETLIGAELKLLGQPPPQAFFVNKCKERSLPELTFENLPSGSIKISYA